MKLSIPLIALTTIAFLPVSAHASSAHGGGTHATAAASADPCGYRRRGWQATVDLSNLVNNASNSEFDAATTLQRGNYVNFELETVAQLHGYGVTDEAWLDLHRGVRYVYRAFRAQAKGKSANARKFVLQAYGMRNAAQSALKALCPGNGKPSTAAGKLDAFGYQSGSLSVRVATPAQVTWQYRCPPTSIDNAIKDIPATSALLTLTVTGPSKAPPSNPQTNGGLSGSAPLMAPGSYTLQVASQCAWHVHVA
jgi:hypothetical protein